MYTEVFEETQEWAVLLGEVVEVVENNECRVGLEE